MSQTAYLVLENGMVFEGSYFGAEREVTGEIVFTTGMTGYLETLTDPSYYGQMVLQTFPLIGNYGVIPSDFESSSVKASAYIVKHWCQEPSNFRSEGDLDTFFKQHDIVGLSGIDTRALTKVIRENGVMNGKITAQSPENLDLSPLHAYKVTDAVKSVSRQSMTHEKVENPKYKVALFDFGLKENIHRELLQRDCEVFILPYNSTAKDVLELAPDGIMLSNGPGDPAENTQVIQNLKEIITLGIPIFGICLGHQLLALANEFQTEKLKYGHRGSNQPVKHVTTGSVYITSQNHGYAVVSNSIDFQIAQQLFYNVNDKTCEGILYTNAPIFSVQFHPEACSGPLDTAFLFDTFIENMEERKDAIK